MPDIYLRERSSVYQARIKVGTEIRRISTGQRNPDDARKEAERLELEANARLKQKGDLTLIEASARFLARDDLKPRTKKEYKRNLADFVELWGDPVIRTIDRQKVRDFIAAKLRSDAAQVQLRRDLAFLSSLMTHAQNWGCGIDINPVRGLNLKGIKKAKDYSNWLRPHEVDKLVAACTKDEHRRFIRLAVFTGMRHQELCKLRWDEIDLDRGFIYLGGDRTKNSDARQIALSDIAYSTLSDTPKTHRLGYVFKGRKDGEPAANMGSAWLRIRKRAGMPNVRIHDLRHTFASWLKQQGVQETTIMTMMGHRTRHMVKRYSHDSDQSLTAAIAKLNADTLSNTQATD